MNRVLDAVRAGDAVFEWIPIVSGPVTLWVFADALKVAGVRVVVNAAEAQRVADVLDALLTTPKVEDLIWMQAVVRIEPHPGDVTQKTAAQHSGEIDRDVAGRAGLVCTVGKSWVLTNSLREGRAANYGWHGTGAKYPARTIPGVKVWQPLGTAHNAEHVDYCVAPEVRVLTADMRWIAAGELEQGDEVVGFDERLTRAAKYRSSHVVRIERRMLECVEIVTDCGTVVSSMDHRWVSRRDRLGRKEAAIIRNARRRAKEAPAGKSSLWRWVRAEDLSVGETIAFMVDPWEVDESRDGGWMSGILDGEGWCSPPTGVGVGQKRGVVLDRIRAHLQADGFDVRESENSKQGVMRLMAAGQRMSLRVLGRYQPLRLLPKARQLWEGTSVFCGGRTRKHARIISVRRVGIRETVALQTTTKTLVCEGMLSHNSQTLRLVRRACDVGGTSADLCAVLKDPKLAPFVSHEGVLKVLRQPGVSPFVLPTRAPTEPFAAVDPSKPLRERALAWCLAEAQRWADKPVSDDRVVQYLSGCERSGKGIGDWLGQQRLTTHNVSFCAAAQGYAERQMEKPGEASPPWRAGAREIERDALDGRRGTWIGAEEARSGIVPPPGSLCVYWREPQAQGVGHVERVIDADGFGYRSVGANEANGRWVVDASPVPYTHPRLLGFVVDGSEELTGVLAEDTPSDFVEPAMTEADWRALRLEVDWDAERAARDAFIRDKDDP